MMPQLRRTQAWIDPDEEDRDSRLYVVRESQLSGHAVDPVMLRRFSGDSANLPQK